MIEHLHKLGVTAIELLPIHSFVDERHLLEHGLQELLGLQLAELLCARAALCGRQRAQCIPLDGRRTAQRRHRGDPRRGVQPHLRGQSPRPDALLQGYRQRRLLLAGARPAALLRELHRHRQRAEPHPSARVADGDGFAALLGRGVSHRRLPLRPGQHARPHAGVRSARRVLRRDPPGSGAGQRQADRRAVGHRDSAAIRSAAFRPAGRSGTTSTARPCAATGAAKATCWASLPAR